MDEFEVEIYTEISANTIQWKMQKQDKSFIIPGIASDCIL